MRGAAGWSKIGGVEPIVIRLELRLADQSVNGRAVDAAGKTREFAGWMGLVAAIDALASAAPSPADSGEEPGAGHQTGGG